MGFHIAPLSYGWIRYEAITHQITLPFNAVDGGGLKCRPSNSSGTDLAVAHKWTTWKGEGGTSGGGDRDKKITLPII